VMLSILAEKICDNRFLRLIKQMLQAGYLEEWTWNATLSGAPQGSVVSPVLSNIYMDRLDTFVETVLILQNTRGKRRKNNPAYFKMAQTIWRASKRGDRAVVRELKKQRRGLPCRDPQDPGYRRLHYIRYADDHLLGFTGPKAEAEQIKARLSQFLRDDLKLELNEDKTVITHGRTRAATFLGYEITVQHSQDRPAVNGCIGLRVPRSVIKAKCATYLKRGKPERRPELMNRDDLTIIGSYGVEYRGLIQYYLLASDVWRLDRLEWVAKTSMLKTLAAKHGSTVSKMARKYKATIVTPHGPRTCFEASLERSGKRARVARFGGIPLRRQKKAVLDDRAPVPATRPKELISRLWTGRCEWCEQKATVEVHQVRNLAALTPPGRPQPAWAQLMTAMRRKTLVVCTSCHQVIHADQPTAALTE
ncbi:reverse transcriptase/maturase family protein, partial [Streptomyces violascens]|uniref:reverse transcriptase/maturase family protein n=1 Tax=Streptomyces violascens TaxID=67381 RepID=UPI0036B8904E